jgi:hypothetical protein
VLDDQALPCSVYAVVRIGERAQLVMFLAKPPATGSQINALLDGKNSLTYTTVRSKLLNSVALSPQAKYSD